MADRARAVTLACCALAFGCARRPASSEANPPRSRPPPIAPTVAAAPTVPAPAPAPTPGRSACEGARLDLLAAIADPSCRIGEDEASALRAVLEDPAQAPLRVEAEALADGRVRVRIRNTGSATQRLPLLVHSHLDSFSAKAGDRPLAAPRPAWPAGFSFETGRMLVKIVLPPAGVAEATVEIDPQLVGYERGHCPPNAKCPEVTVAKGRLPPGEVRLRLRTPLYSIRADLVAEVAWKAR